MKEIDIRQLTESNREALQATVKQLERENAISASKLESKLKKMKQDLLNKTLELEQAGRKSIMNSEEHQQEIEDLQQERQRLLEEISEIETEGKENFLREKERIKEISELEKKNLEGIAENERECLRSEINKLTTVCVSKTEEIRRLYGTIAEIKEANAAERRDLDRLIESLRQRVKVLEEDNIEELELLKVKMAQLHQSDIVNLEKYYENEVALLLTKIK